MISKLEMKDILTNKTLTDKDNEEVNLLLDDVIQNLHKIIGHGKRAENIVKNMLQHARSSSGIKELTDINFLAEEYLKLSYHGFRSKHKLFNVALTTTFEPLIDKISIVPQDVGHVLMNLFNNAFYSVGEKAKINEPGYEPAITVSTYREGAAIKIKIRDNGLGIAPKYLDKIYQPFFTTKPTGEGTGLGLSLSHDIIKAHQGELKVDSKEGEFAEFTITFLAG